MHSLHRKFIKNLKSCCIKIDIWVILVIIAQQQKKGFDLKDKKTALKLVWMSGISKKSIWKSAKLRRQSHYTAEVSNLNARNLQLDFLSGSLSLVSSLSDTTWLFQRKKKTHMWISIYKKAYRFLFSYRCMYRQPVGRTLRKLNRTPPQLQCLQIEIIILGRWKKHITYVASFYHCHDCFR